MPGRINGGVANYLTLGVRGCVAAGVVLRWVQLLVLDLRVSVWIQRIFRILGKRVSGLRIRTDEGLSKEAVPTVHP